MRSTRPLITAMLVCVQAASAMASSGGVPVTLQHSGYLLDASDRPVDGTLALEIGLYDAPSGGTLEWSGACSAVAVRAGYYAVELGGAACPGTGGAGNATLETSDLPATAARFLELRIAGVTLTPRVAIADRQRAMGDVAGLQAALDGKAPATHAHDGLYPRLDGAYSDPSWIGSVSASKVTWPAQAAGAVFAGPASGTGAPAFRAIAAGDLPAPGGDLSGPFGSATVAKLGGVGIGSLPGTSGQVLRFDGGLWNPARLAPGDLGTGTPTATSVLRGDGSWGSVRLSDDAATCTSSISGAMRLRAGRYVEVCSTDGSAFAWRVLVAGGNDGTGPALAGVSCKAILDAGFSTGDKAYWIRPSGAATASQVYCDMTNGGWTLLAKFSNTNDWLYANARWTDASTLNTGLLTDVTTVGSAKSELWSSLAVAQLRLDEIGASTGAGRFVVFNNTATQTVSALMSAAGATLTVTAGAITNFTMRDPLFQGTAGTQSATLRTNWVGTHGLTWPSCNSVQNRVRLGSANACQDCSGVNGGANAGYTGLGGSTSWRDLHASDCTSYAQQPESYTDTSGENVRLWGR